MNSAYLEDLFTALRFPSISTDPARAADVRANAEWLAGKLLALGLSTQIYPTAKHPVIVARNPVKPGRPTVLLYGHYDVQPVDPLEQWISNPFEPDWKTAGFLPGEPRITKASTWRTSAALRKPCAFTGICR